MTDPTITIAGLEARIKCLVAALRTANTGRAEAATLDSAACGYNAQLRTERDALAAQLAEVRAELAAAPKVCAIHSYALEGPCMTCGAPWPGAEKALRQERIEGMEKMRRISAAVGCPNSVEEVVEAVAAIKSDLASERAHLAACQTRIAGLEQAADERSAEVARLTARVAELEARPVLTHEILSAAIKKARKVPPYIARQAADEYMPHLGPVTLPAQDRAEELTDAIESRLAAIGFSGFGGRIPYTDRIRIVEESLASLGAPPTSPPAARPVFAEVSEDELIRLFYVVGTDGIDHGEQCPPIDSSDRNGLRAVLARLEVSLVAPVDLAAIERAVKAYHNASGEHAVPADALGTGQWRAAVLAMTDAFLAAGIPVTPEVGK
jgi:hypothetical protein